MGSKKFGKVQRDHAIEINEQTGSSTLYGGRGNATDSPPITPEPGQHVSHTPAGLVGRTLLDEQGNLRVREVALLVIVASVAYVFSQDNHDGGIDTPLKLGMTILKCVVLAILLGLALWSYRAILRRSEPGGAVEFNAFIIGSRIVAVVLGGAIVLWSGWQLGVTDYKSQLSIEAKTQLALQGKARILAAAAALYQQDIDLASQHYKERIRLADKIYSADASDE